MGFELWFSEKTKTSRKGTTYRELQNIFIDNITTKFIYEPLACCKIDDNLVEVKQTLDTKNFDTLGVVDENGNKLGYIIYKDLNEVDISSNKQSFKPEILISDSTPICDLLDILRDKNYVYVLDKNSIEGIVTRADLNKPIVRIYFFGIISLFELHLNYWINENYTEDEWSEKLNDSRLISARNIYEQRKGNSSQLTLLECIQLCDKKSILLKTDDFCDKFKYSKRMFKNFMQNSEGIRNNLAHNQNSITETLSWEDFVSTISSLKKFLENSEKLIRE